MKKIFVNIFIFALLIGICVPKVSVNAAEETDLETTFVNDYVDTVQGLNDIIETEDGGYIACGSGKASNVKYAPIIKTGKNGEDIWSKMYTYDSNGVFVVLKVELLSIDTDKDGGYILCGSMIVKDPANIVPANEIGLVLKLDRNGEVVWQKLISLGVYRDIVATEDGGYVIVGEVFSAKSIDRCAIVVKLDKNGNNVWEKKYESINQGELRLYSIIETKSKEYVICGTSRYGDNFAAYSGWMLKLDINGNELWSKYYTVGVLNYLRDVIETDSGEYVACGNIQQATINEYYDEGWILKVDAEGNQLWSNHFDDSSVDRIVNNCFYSIAETKTNSYIIGGLRLSKIGINIQRVIFEVDEDGKKLRENAQISGAHGAYRKTLVVSDGYVSCVGTDYLNRSVGGYIVKKEFKKYKVNFDANGGNGDMSTVSYMFGEEKQIPKNEFQRKNYTFVGWSFDKNAKDADYTNKANYTNTKKEDVTLYAIWKATPLFIDGFIINAKNNDSFTLTSNVDGEWSCDTTYFEQTIDKDNKATFKAIKAGMGSVSFNATNGESHTSTIHIAEFYYKITFDANGGTGNMELLPCAFEEAKLLTKNSFVRKDYSFEGWALSKGDANDYKVAYKDEANYQLNVREGQTLYAVWKPIQIAVTDMPEAVQVDESFEVMLNIEEQGSLTYDNQCFEVESSQQKSLPIRNKVRFTALKVGTTSITFTSSNGSTVEKTIEIRENYYNVSFDANGGTETMDGIDFVFEEEKELSKNAFIKADYTFLGWALSKEKADEGNIDFLDEAIYKMETKEDQTLYAVWKPIQIEVTDMPEVVQVDDSFEVTLNIEKLGSLEYDNQYFEVDANQQKSLPIGNKVRFTALKAGTTSITFTSSNGSIVAKTIEIRENYYNVSFDANGGTGTMDGIDFVFEEEKKLSKSAFIKEDYVFLGWALSKEKADEGNVEFSDEAIYKMETKEAKQLYAVWKAVEVQLSEIPKDIQIDEVFTITTNIKGNWSFDETMLEIVETKDNLTTFRALKAGGVVLMFQAVNGESFKTDVEINAHKETQKLTEQPNQIQIKKQSSIPATGDATNIGILLMMMSISLIIVKHRRKRR